MIDQKRNLWCSNELVESSYQLIQCSIDINVAFKKGNNRLIVQQIIGKP